MFNKITSLKNEKILELTKLHDKKNIKDIALVESEKIVLEMLKNNRVRALYIEDRFVGLAEKYGVPTYIITKDISKKISGVVTPSGIFATVSIEKVYHDGNYLVLENLQDPTNMGALFRSALASGYKKVILIDSVCPYLPKVTRGSMGYNFKLDITEFKIDDFVRYAKSNNLYLICGDLKGEDVFSFRPRSMPYGIVIGNEGNGISSTMQNICTDVVTIPMQNQVESLNASVSGSILMYVLNQKIKGE